MANIGPSGKQSPTEAAKGGTGLTSITDGGIMLGSGTGPVTVTAQPTNGQLLIGSTGVDPVLAALTEGANVTITNGAGTITVAAAGGSGPGNGDLTQFMVYSDFLTNVDLGSGKSITDGIFYGDLITPSDGDADHPGIAGLVSGSYIKIEQGLETPIFKGDGSIDITVWARTDGAVGSDNFALGLQATVSKTASNAIHWRRRSTDANANWYAATIASSSETKTDSGITILSATWHKFEINVNAAGTSVVFKIDGTTYATHTTNIPTVGLIAVCLGGSNPDLYIDAYLLIKTFTGDRVS